jgi:hypothetical protein
MHVADVWWCSAGGVLEVNAENDPELFSMARVGLGCLGVVTELTLKASVSGT